MKKLLSPLLILALVGLIGYQAFFQQQALREAKQLASEFHLQLDTLQQLSLRYAAIHEHYVEVHQQLIHSYQRTSKLQMDLTDLSDTRQSDVHAIQQELRSLLLAYQQPQALPLHAVDSLLFQP